MRATEQYLSGRVNLTNVLSAKELSERLSPQVRAQAFFSARVAEARVINRLRPVSDAYSSGDLGQGESRVMLKEFLAGSASQTATGPERLDNLASTMRLNLILKQNEAQMAAVGRYAADLDPAVQERFPYYEYEPSDAINPRQEHTQYYGIVLPTNDPFWDDHTPPLDYGCQCRLRLLTADEAEGRVGKARPQDKTNPAGAWVYSGVNGHETIIDRPASGYVFNVKEASLCDLSRLQSPDLISAVMDQAQIEFGDQVRVVENKAMFFEPKQPYKTFGEHDLPSAREWPLSTAPALMNETDAIAALEKGVSVTAPDNNKIMLGQTLLDHWNIEKNKPQTDVIGRAKHLSWAIETVTNPRERWDQDTQSIYLQMFDFNGKSRGLMVAVTKDGQARSYVIKDKSAMDKCRKGKSYEQFK